MLVNWDKGYVFIHVPKTGGTSITKLLKTHCQRPILPLRAIGYVLDHSGVGLPQRAYPWFGYPYHVTAAGLSRCWGERFKGLFSFAFVRNPWDLTVSEYHFIRQKWDHRHRSIVRRLGSFDAYVAWKCDRPDQMNQVDWLDDPSGHRLVDFVGRFERFENDATELLRTIGANGSLPHANATARGDYRSYYYSDRLVEKVATYHSRDIQAFGYAFG